MPLARQKTGREREAGAKVGQREPSKMTACMGGNDIARGRGETEGDKETRRQGGRGREEATGCVAIGCAPCTPGSRASACRGLERRRRRRRGRARRGSLLPPGR